MKSPANRYKVQRLFILGAGASYSVSRGIRSEVRTTCPLDANFCKQIESIQTEKLFWVPKSRDQVISAWKDHAPFKDFGLEAAIQRQLGNLEFIRAIHARKNAGAIDPADYLNQVSHLIAYVLNKTKENSKKLYSHFVQKVFPQSVPYEQQKNRIITFNYDTLLDEYLLKKIRGQESLL